MEEKLRVSYSGLLRRVVGWTHTNVYRAETFDHIHAIQPSNLTKECLLFYSKPAWTPIRFHISGDRQSGLEL